MFRIEAMTSASKALLERAESILIGVSPLNSAYTPGSVRERFTWAASRFKQVHMLTAGHEVVNRLVDQGIPARAAARRCVRKINELRYAARCALDLAGYSEPDRFLHVWTKLEERSRYRDLLADTYTAYQAGDAFTQVCRSEAARACTTWLARPPTAGEVEHNVPYLLAEVPLFLDSPAILGVSSSVFAYHARPPLVQALIDGVAPELRPVPEQGFAILTSDQQERTGRHEHDARHLADV